VEQTGILELQTRTDLVVLLDRETPVPAVVRAAILGSFVFGGPSICFCGTVVEGSTVCAQCSEKMASALYASLIERGPAEPRA
jgi:hypothetical protein